MKRGHFGVYNPCIDRSKLDDVGQHREDIIILAEILYEFCFLAKYKVHMFATDELSRGFMKMAMTKEIPTWLTFATAVFLDIHATLREVTDRGFHQLQRIGTDSKKTLFQHADISRGLKSSNTWTKHNQQHLDHLAENLDRFILKGALFSFKTDRYWSQDVIHREKAKDFTYTGTIHCFVGY
jgi:hypothetical protein